MAHGVGARIRAKLAEARQRGLNCFGSESHRFKLGPCLSDAEVAAFEARHGIRLPEAYRKFVLEVGNGAGGAYGGAGPYYGIQGLRLEAVVEDLARPCPLTPETKLADDELWFEAIGIATEEDCFHGTLHLGTQGCNYDMLLVVTGPARGRVLYVSWGEGLPHFVPDADFLAWYERWLDELLAGWNMDGFGYGTIGTEEEFVARLLRAEATEDERRQAASGLRRLPVLAPQTIDLLVEAMDDPRPAFRCLAVGLLAHAVYKPVAGQVRRMLEDPESSVREAAVHAAPKLLGADWPKLLRPLCRDPGLASAALCELGREKKLTWKDLQPLLDSPEVCLRRAAVNNLCYLHPNVDGNTMIRLLSDEDVEVRTYAIQGVQLYVPRSQSPRLLRARVEQEPNPEVRRSLAMALQYFPGREARAALELLTQDTDQGVRETAQACLAQHRPR